MECGQPGAEVEPVAVRQVNVEQHHVRREALDSLEGRGDRIRLSGYEQTSAPQQPANQVPRARRVVDDQDPRGAASATWGDRAYAAQSRQGLAPPWLATHALPHWGWLLHAGPGVDIE
jgi:hypothetical protein